MDPKPPYTLSDPYTPEEAGTEEVPVPEEMPIDDAPLHDWEIPDGGPDVIN